MADISITASAVRGSRGDSANAGATITAGQVVYKDASTNWQLSDCNGSGTQVVDGVALHASLSGQPLAVANSGNVTLNAVLTAGTFYFLSATPGAICPFADLGSGMKVILIGYATSTTNLVLIFKDTGITL